jgi:putative hydrolase of the HAD superfamily
MDVRALLFDVNGTLIDIETDERMEQIYRAIAHFLTYQGIPLHRGEVRDLYFQVMKEQFAASKETYPERGISRKRLAVFPQAQEMLEELNTRYHLAVVSDAQSVYGLPELRATGLAGYFSPIIISGDYGYRKPDPRLFQAALQALRVSPEEAIFIGNDRLRDVYGARQVGMKTILFCPNGVPSGSPETEPEYVLCGYNDLPRAIQFLSGS